MKLVLSIDPIWRKRFWALATVVVFILLVSHPELRLILPLIDAIGLDVIVGLLVFQASVLFQPMVVSAQSRLALGARRVAALIHSGPVLNGVAGFIGYGVFHWLGGPGQRLWFMLDEFFRPRAWIDAGAFRVARDAPSESSGFPLARE